MNAVNVWTEWGKLEEIIIGDPVGYHREKDDLVFRFIYENWDGKFREKNKKYVIHEQYIEERKEDLDNLQKLLEKRGIKVQRPKRVKNPKTIKTPYFESIEWGCDAPRDSILIVGNTIIETPPTNRKRYFEGLLFQDLFLDYFKRGARWISAPKPSLDESKLDFSYWQNNFGKPITPIEKLERIYEIAFDAANCLKFGKDIIMNVGTQNHEWGLYWLQRELGDIRVHPIRLCDSHIDWQFMPLSPGALLYNGEQMHSKWNLLPPGLQKWKRIPIMDEENQFDYPSSHHQMSSSKGMDINILSLDSKTILIRDSAKKTAERLYKEGYDPIPIKLRHSELFGNGIHCCSIDVRRNEKMEDYLK